MYVGIFMCVQEHVCVRGHVCEQGYVKDMGQVWVLSSGTVHLFKDRTSGWPLTNKPRGPTCLHLLHAGTTRMRHQGLFKMWVLEVELRSCRRKYQLSPPPSQILHFFFINYTEY